MPVHFLRQLAQAHWRLEVLLLAHADGRAAIVRMSPKRMMVLMSYLKGAVTLSQTEPFCRYGKATSMAFLQVM